MPAAHHDIIIDQGETFSKVLTWKAGSPSLSPVDLTGFTGKMQVRTLAGNLVVELSTANSRISLGGTAGTITLTIASADTSTLLVGTHSYDLFVTSSGGVSTRLLFGSAKVRERVTT